MTCDEHIIRGLDMERVRGRLECVRPLRLGLTLARKEGHWQKRGSTGHWQMATDKKEGPLATGSWQLAEKRVQWPLANATFCQPEMMWTTARCITTFELFSPLHRFGHNVFWFCMKIISSPICTKIFFSQQKRNFLNLGCNFFSPCLLLQNWYEKKRSQSFVFVTFVEVLVEV